LDSSEPEKKFAVLFKKIKQVLQIHFLHIDSENCSCGGSRSLSKIPIRPAIVDNETGSYALQLIGQDPRDRWAAWRQHWWRTSNNHI